MLFLLDTNAVSDLLRRHAKARARLSSLSPADQVRTCAIVRGEILFGIDRLAPGKNKNDLRLQAESLFQTAACEPVRVSAAQAYSQIK